MQPLIKSWPALQADVLAPLHFPKHPLDMVQFGWKALSTANQLAKRFRTDKAKGFWGGLGSSFSACRLIIWPVRVSDLYY